MSHCTALLDANVLYPAPTRDVFLQLAVTGVFGAKWSDDIQHEWIEALLRNQPHRDRAALERTRAQMDRATPDCLVADYEDLVPSLELPDPGDRHVLAAAIAGGCDVIVTWNLKHFPESILDHHGIKKLNPDDFLSDHLTRMPDRFCLALRKIRKRLRSPRYGVEEHLDILVQQGLKTTAEKLKPFKAQI